MKKNTFSIIVFILSIIVLFILFIVFSYIKTYSCNYDGEYIKSISSNHYFCISNVDSIIDARFFSAKLINNHIDLLYYDLVNDSLKLARSISKTPKSHEDWKVSTVVRGVSFSNRGLNNPQEIEFNNNVDIDAISYNVVSGKPHIAYCLQPLNESSPFYLIVLQAINCNPNGPEDWVFHCKSIPRFTVWYKMSSEFCNGQFIFILNTLKPRLNSQSDFNVILHAYTPSTKKWQSSIILKNIPGDGKFVIAELIPNPDKLLLVYFKTSNIKNSSYINNSIPMYLLSIPDGVYSNRTSWKHTFVLSKDFDILNPRSETKVSFDLNKSLVNLFFTTNSSNYINVAFSIKDGKPILIKDCYRYRTPTSALKMLNRYELLGDSSQLAIVNNKLVGSFAYHGVLERCDYDNDFAHNNPRVSFIDIFYKMMSNPSRIRAVATDNGLSYFILSPHLRQIRFAREVDPSEMPKRNSWFKYGKLK